MLIILAVVFLIVTIEGCKGTDIKPFPAKEIYTFFKDQEGCYVANVISTDPIMLGVQLKLTEDQCPSGAMGVAYSDISKVRDWVKDTQKKAKENCQ